MNDYIKQLQPVFQQISDKIGQGAGFVWETVLRQQYVYAVEATVFIFPLLVILFFLNKWRKVIIEDQWDELSWIPFSLALIFNLLLIGLCIEISVTRFINPQFYALDYFIGIVRPSGN